MKKHLLALALISGAFVSCTDDSYDLDNISNDFRIGVNEYLPIAHSSVNLKDLLDEFKTEYVDEDEDGKLFFVFDTTTTINIKPFEINIDEGTFDIASDIEIEESSIPNTFTNTFEFPIELGIDEEDGSGKIEKIHIKEGRFEFKIETNNFDADALVLSIDEIPGIKGTTRSTESKDGGLLYVVDDCWIEFPEDGKLNARCRVSVSDTYNGPVPVTGGNLNVSIVCKKTSITYYSIYGSLKSLDAQNDYTNFNIDLFEENLDFDLKVLDPKLTISAKTNAGMPIDCTFRGFVGKHSSKKDSKKDSVVATFKNNADTFNIAMGYAKKEGDVVPAFHEEFDKVHGSLDKIFSYLPDSVTVRSAFKVNADSGSYFLLDSTFLDVNINARIPLHVGSGSYLTINDTIDGVDILKEIEDYQDSDFGVEKAEVILEIENKLPLEAIVDVKFCNVDSVTNKTKVFTSIGQSVKVNSASVVDSRSGKSIPSKKTISVDDTMLDDIKQINTICFQYKIKVPTGVDENGVLLTSDCGLSAKAYAHVKANITNSKEK